MLDFGDARFAPRAVVCPDIADDRGAAGVVAMTDRFGPRGLRFAPRSSSLAGRVGDDPRAAGCAVGLRAGLRPLARVGVVIQRDQLILTRRRLPVVVSWESSVTAPAKGCTWCSADERECHHTKQAEPDSKTPPSHCPPFDRGLRAKRAPKLDAATPARAATFPLPSSVLHWPAHSQWSSRPPSRSADERFADERKCKTAEPRRWLSHDRSAGRRSVAGSTGDRRSLVLVMSIRRRT